jgi:ABC-type spermidine/putrescine transport system permease subunit I
VPAHEAERVAFLQPRDQEREELSALDAEIDARDGRRTVVLLCDAFNFGVPAIVVCLVHAQFPYMLLTLYAGLDAVDFTLVEAARDLGASRVAVFRDILWPLTLPNVVAGSLFVFVPALGAFVAPKFLGAGRVLMVGQLITGRIDSYNVASASAAATFVVVFVVLAFGVALRHAELGATARGDGG